ncbi:MAG: ferritin family protein [candidate division Zixibacteria bacterium]
MSSDALSKDVIKQAIVAEIDGQKFYKFLSVKATNPDAKRKLNNLAQDEFNHEALLIKMYKDIYGEEVDELPKEGVSVLSKFFTDHREDENLSEMQYIDMAIEAELAATNYYRNGSATAPNDKIKKVCEDMAAEEFRHYESLKAEREAISGGHFWFGFDEGAPLED